MKLEWCYSYNYKWHANSFLLDVGYTITINDDGEFVLSGDLVSEKQKNLTFLELTAAKQLAQEIEDEEFEKYPRDAGLNIKFSGVVQRVHQSNLHTDYGEVSDDDGFTIQSPQLLHFVGQKITVQISREAVL